MTTRKIFIISGKESSEEESSSRKNVKIAKALVESKIKYWHGLHVLSILSCCALAMSVVALIPRNNSILEQSYWFEIIFPAEFGVAITATMKVLDLFLWTKKKSLLTFRFLAKYYSVVLLTWITSFSVSYIIWTQISEYNHPMPLFGLLCRLTNWVVELASLTLLLKSHGLGENGFKMKLKFFCLYSALCIMVIFWKFCLSNIFNILDNTNAQCIIAILVPMSKKFSTYILAKVMHRAIGTENEGANVGLAASVHLSFGLFVATKMVGARVATIICMASVEILMQLKMSYQIVKLNKKVTTNGNEQIEMEMKKAISKLLLAELCEGLVPLAYAICFAIAYYGPNAELIGNVKNGSWQYKEVKDVSQTFLVMLLLFTIDLISLALNSFIIWTNCNVNLFNELCHLLQKYWFVLAWKLTNSAYGYFLVNDVNMGSDFTQKFEWITNDKDYNITSNMTPF